MVLTFFDGCYMKLGIPRRGAEPLARPVAATKVGHAPHDGVWLEKRLAVGQSGFLFSPQDFVCHGQKFDSLMLWSG